MDKERRFFLKSLAGVGAGLTVAPMMTGTANASGGHGHVDADEHVSILYDATKCIGCKSCENACKAANGFPPELTDAGRYEAPRDLSEKTVNIIKLYKGEEGESFIKRQCMHCVEPSCVSGCPTSALRKGPDGIVTYDKWACCGCRYCQMNCPYNVPKFQFNNWYGEIVKCEFCYDTNMLTAGQPACTQMCPTGSALFGKRKDMLAEAKRRIAAHPDRYVDHIYGEHEGGGTSVLIIASVPAEKLGMPDLPDYSQASVTEGIQHTLYKGLILPAFIYAVLAGIAFKNRTSHGHDDHEEE